MHPVSSFFYIDHAFFIVEYNEAATTDINFKYSPKLKMFSAAKPLTILSLSQHRALYYSKIH